MPALGSTFQLGGESTVNFCSRRQVQCSERTKIETGHLVKPPSQKRPRQDGRGADGLLGPCPLGEVVNVVDREAGKGQQAPGTLHEQPPRLRVVDLGGAGQGKGGKVRPVPVRADLWALLEDFRPDDVDADQPVFVSRKGGRLSRQQVCRIVRRSAKGAGIDTEARPVSPHWLRRACGAHLADRGVPMHQIRDLLDHASVTTTDDYTPADPTDSVTDALPG